MKNIFEDQFVQVDKLQYVYIVFAENLSATNSE